MWSGPDHGCQSKAAFANHFSLDFAAHMKCHWHAVVWKGKWMENLVAEGRNPPAGFIRSEPLIPLAGTGPFPAVSCSMSYARLPEWEGAHPAVWTLRWASVTALCSSSGLWNTRNSDCLVAVFVSCRLACVTDSMAFYVLPRHVAPSDERPIRRGSNCVHFGHESSAVSHSSSSLEKLQEGKISRSVEAGGDFSGLQWNDVRVVLWLSEARVWNLLA